MMTDLRIEDIPERWREKYAMICAKSFHSRGGHLKEIKKLIEDIAFLEARNAELEALAKKWATDAPLSERRTIHEASVAYRRAAGIFPNPDGVKAILDK